MSPLRFRDLQARPTVVLDMTSLTVEEFHSLVPAFERAFQEHMRVWRLDGKPRTARSYTTYANCPLPMPEDRLLFILVYMKTNPLQVAHGLLFDLTQGKTNQWLHVLLVVLRTALRQLGDAPARSLTALAQRLGLSQEHAQEVSAPLFAMTEPNDVSRVPKMLLNRKAVSVARKSVIPSRTSC